MQEELHRHKFLSMNTPLKQFINTVLMITLFNFCLEFPHQKRSSERSTRPVIACLKMLVNEMTVLYY